MTDKIEDEGLHPEDFGPPVTELVDPDPRPRRKRRLLWSAALLVVGALVGAWLGWSRTEPLYRVGGLIYIAPNMPSPADPGGRVVMPMFEGFVRYQVSLLRSPRASLLAMDTDAWIRTGEPTGPAFLEAFEGRRRIIHPKETQHIWIQFVDPDSGIALAGVRALLHAYQNLSADLNGANESLEYARAKSEMLTTRLKAASDQLLTVTAEYGGLEGLEIRHRASIHSVLSTEANLEALRTVIADHGRTQGEESATMGQLKARERGLLARLEHLRAKNRKLAKVRMDVERLLASEMDLRRLLQQVDALRDQLTAQLVGKGRITVADPGTEPTEYYRDDRRANAATWAGFSALPGLIALLVTAWRGRRSKRAPAAA